MNNALFEQLLYEEESATLDFKKEQYRFVRATDEEKSELLKDILGFVNAWRRSDAYILIGVEEVRGGKSNVLGIQSTDHLDDHALQQFVNNITNQPVRFHYEAFGFEGKQVGIIRIETQTRPIYLKRGYGRLEKERVYVRRGSSTDPTKPASLEEIAQMRVGTSQAVTELSIQFSDTKKDVALGTSLSLAVELCEPPSERSIPDYSISRRTNSFNFTWDHGTNTDFLRELADFECARRLFRPVRLVVCNTSQIAAGNVRVEFSILVNTGVVILYPSELPDRPKRRSSILNIPPMSFHPASRNPGQVDISKNDEQYHIEIDCGDLQPGRRVWSDVFYISKKVSGDFLLHGLVYADNLPQPENFELTISLAVSKTSLSLDGLYSLAEQVEQDN